jgi:hypothetical protein
MEAMGEDEMPDFGKWLIHGPQGSGKTTLASTLGQIGKTLFIDLMGEHGTQSFKGSPWEKNIDIRRPHTITALDDMFYVLASGKHDYKCAVIDSTTGAQKMANRFISGHDETAVREIRKGTAPMDIRAWGQTLDIMTDMATFWFSLADATRTNPIHVAFTAQTKMIENEDTGTMVRTPDVQKGALSIMLAAPAYILYTDVEENIDAIGDDSLPATNHIVRFGSDPSYRIKARVPYDLRGKIPPVLGRKRPTSLYDLSKVLRIGGVPDQPFAK